MNRWITNLEDLTRTDQFAPEYLDRVKADYAKIRRVHGDDVVIGPPMATEEKSAGQIANDGYVGVYMPGTAFK